jgi:hypothetical protein
MSIFEKFATLAGKRLRAITRGNAACIRRSQRNENTSAISCLLLNLAFQFFMQTKTLVRGAFAIAVLLLIAAQVGAQQAIKVRVNRWIEARKVSGSVTYQNKSETRSARVGDRLQGVNDSISTGNKSAATLLVDTGIGFIEISENTKLQVQSLGIAPDNGRITRLKVTGGQVRLKLRHFTHKGSQLEVETPASVSGVRGTDFGVAVQPNGKTGLAVFQGGVSTAAQKRSVAVRGGFQNFTIPGEVPSSPVPLKNDTRLLEYKFERDSSAGIRKVRLIGRVDPVNSVLVEGIPRVTDRDGWFGTDPFLLPNSLTIQVVVITPLGKRQIHNVPIPY